MGKERRILWGIQSSHTRILQESPRPIMWLMFRDSVLYFLLVLCAVPVMLFMDAQLGLSIMSITVTHMLLRFRKIFSDACG